MKVTINCINRKLWEETMIEAERSKFHPPRITGSDIVNEALALRQAKKQQKKGGKL